MIRPNLSHCPKCGCSECCVVPSREDAHTKICLNCLYIFTLPPRRIVTKTTLDALEKSYELLRVTRPSERDSQTDEAVEALKKAMEELGYADL